MNDIITTFDLTKFEDLKCPMLNSYHIKNVRVPDMTKLVNKVFYMEYEGGITAFKILDGQCIVHHIVVIILVFLFKHQNTKVFGII